MAENKESLIPSASKYSAAEYQVKEAFVDMKGPYTKYDQSAASYSAS
jgi:hypothetical protein